MINEEQKDIDDKFREACISGDLEKVRYCLTSSELTFHANIHAIHPFRHACQFGHLEIVKYLLTSPELKEHASASQEEEIFLFSAVINKRLDVVKYLLGSPDLSIKPNLHIDDDLVFTNSCSKKDYDMLRYFITDLNIEKSNAISKYLERNPDPKVDSLFDMRELNSDLNKNLHNNYDNQRRPKV